MKFVTLMSKFFGRKPGQSLAEFSAELKELTDEDKEELGQLAADELGVEFIRS